MTHQSLADPFGERLLLAPFRAADRGGHLASIGHGGRPLRMRLRYSVRTALVLITLAAALLGASQFRRQRLRTWFAELEQQGVSIAIPDQWRDLLWPRSPQQALIRVSLHEQGAIHINDQRFMIEAGRERVRQLQQALADLGVPNVFILMIKQTADGRQYLVTSPTVDVLR